MTPRPDHVLVFAVAPRSHPWRGTRRRWRRAVNEQVEVEAERRVVKGKQVRRLRQKGLIPATLYGHHLGSVSLQVQREAIEEILRRGRTSSLLRLRVGRERPATVLLKQMQFHPVRGELIHVDFYGVAAGEKLRAQVPLRFVGEAPVAETHDVAIVRPVEQVEVECYPADLPGAVEVNLSLLRETDSVLHVRDLDAGPRVSIMSPPEEVVASVAVAAKEVIATLEERAEEAAEAAEAGEETRRAA